MELCWLMTGKCNQNCYYCDRFHSANDLLNEEYDLILDKLINYGVKQLTFGGGESLLVDCFADIAKKASDKGIHLKLVTNGKLIPKNKSILKYLDEITLSIDSIDNNVNEELGRGFDHYNSIIKAIEVIKSCGGIRLNINTVVTKINLKQIEFMKDAIEKWGVNQWRVFRFCPLRETAAKNKEKFEINGDEFLRVSNVLLSSGFDGVIQFRDYADMESGYLLINPEGKLCVSKDMKDTIVGDMLKDDLKQWFA